MVSCVSARFPRESPAQPFFMGKIAPSAALNHIISHSPQKNKRSIIRQSPPAAASTWQNSNGTYLSKLMTNYSSQEKKPRPKESIRHLLVISVVESIRQPCGHRGACGRGKGSCDCSVWRFCLLPQNKSLRRSFVAVGSGLFVFALGLSDWDEPTWPLKPKGKRRMWWELANLANSLLAPSCLSYGANCFRARRLLLPCDHTVTAFETSRRRYPAGIRVNRVIVLDERH